MPADPHLYPPDWRATSLAVRERAGWRCECEGECGLHRGRRCEERGGEPARGRGTTAGRQPSPMGAVTQAVTPRPVWSSTRLGSRGAVHMTRMKASAELQTRVNVSVFEGSGPISRAPGAPAPGVTSDGAPDMPSSDNASGVGSVSPFDWIRQVRAIPANTLPLADRMVLLILASHADGTGTCYPGVPLLAEECGMSERGVQKALARLRATGWIVHRGRGPRGVNVVHLNMVRGERGSPRGVNVVRPGGERGSPKEYRKSPEEESISPPTPLRGEDESPRVRSMAARIARACADWRPDPGGLPGPDTPETRNALRETAEFLAATRHPKLFLDPDVAGSIRHWSAWLQHGRQRDVAAAMRLAQRFVAADRR